MTRKHAREEMERWLRKRDREGLTYGELSVESGIPVPTLSWWSQKLRKEPRGEGEPPSCELVPVEIVEEAVDGGAIEIRVGDGLRVLVPASASESHLARVLRAASATC